LLFLEFFGVYFFLGFVRLGLMVAALALNRRGTWCVRIVVGEIFLAFIPFSIFIELIQHPLALLFLFTFWIWSKKYVIN